MSLINLINKQKEELQVVEEGTSIFKSRCSERSPNYNKSNLDCKIWIDFTRKKKHWHRFKIVLDAVHSTEDNNYTVSVSLPSYEVAEHPDTMTSKQWRMVECITEYMKSRVLCYMITERLNDINNTIYNDSLFTTVIDKTFRDWDITEGDSDKFYNKTLSGLLESVVDPSVVKLEYMESKEERRARLSREYSMKYYTED